MTNQPYQPPPAISISATYRQIGEGPEDITVRWDAGARLPDADEVCDVIRALATATTPTVVIREDDLR